MQCLLPATPDEIRGIIHNLNNSTSGWDGIKPLGIHSPIYLNCYVTL